LPGGSRGLGDVYKRQFVANRFRVVQRRYHV
jgi:hypothetical protein